MNAFKTAPLLAVLLLLFMAAPASAQVIAQAGVRVQVNVGGSAKHKRRSHRNQARRGKSNTSRHNARRNHNNRRNNTVYYRESTRVRAPHRYYRPAPRPTVVHKHVVVHEHVHTTPAPPQQFYPMEDVQFYRMVAQIEDEPFSSGKLNLITMAAERNYFSSAQIYTVVSSLTFAADKVEAAVLMYPMVVDPDAFYQVLSAFTFESSKDQVRARLGL